MPSLSHNSQRVAAVATALRPESDEHPLFLAAALARRLNLELNLVHALDLARFERWVAQLSTGLSLKDLKRQTERLARAAAREKLAVVQAGLSHQLEVTTSIYSGSPTASLIEDSQQKKTALTIVGVRTKNPHFPQEGASTALGLMTSAPIPVIVVGDDTMVDFSTNSFRIVIVDDLRSSSLMALRTAFALAAEFRNCQILHIHAYGNLREQLLESLTGFLDVAWPVLDQKIHLQSLTLADIASRQQELQQRASSFLPRHLASGGHYEVRLASGALGDTVPEIALEYAADLVVYGRHQHFHHLEQRSGVVPLHEMLGQKAAIMVVAEDASSLLDALTNPLASTAYSTGSTKPCFSKR